jgi:predicted outer membrane repeat protein
MKKSTLTFLALAMAVSPMSAETLQVTSATMDASVDGSLLNVLSKVPDATATTIEFNLDTDTLDYNTEACPGFSVANKIITFDGVNKKDNKPMTIKGLGFFMDISVSSEVTISNMGFTGFKGIAFKMADGTKLSVTSCKFFSNIDPKSESGNNGAIVRMSGGTLTVDKCVFLNNKAMGSYGGGSICIYQSSATAPQVRILNSSFVHNTAISGGAVAVNARSGKGSVPNIYIANCTFANNIVSNRGGAIYMQTAETSSVLSPVIVNCTFVGNINEITSSDDGGAINFWSRATTTMAPVLINNLFAENYYNVLDPTKARLNDVKAFYLDGDVSGGTTQSETVKSTCINNMFAASADKYYTVLPKANNNKLIDFATDNIFMAKEANPWNEGDSEYPYMTCMLDGEQMVAMISENSIVQGAGVATYASYEIPTTDQLGNPRSTSAPSIGAIENIVTGISSTVAASNLHIAWLQNSVIAYNLNGVAPLYVYDITGKIVFKGKITNNTPVKVVNLTPGLYIATVQNAVIKFIVK